MNLKNKTAVITGGSDGLGLAIAKLLAAKKTNVIIISRSKEKVDVAVRQIGDTAQGFSADVSNLSELQKIADRMQSVDILINNAGVWLEGSIVENTEQEIKNTIDTNLTGVIFTTKVFLPKLQESSDAHLINVSSTSGLKGRDNQAVYAATKFGVAGFTDSLKVDLANTNIKVSGFYPGGMNTALFEKSGAPKDNSDWMDVDKVAEVIVFMLEQDASMVLDHMVLNKRKTSTSN